MDERKKMEQEGNAVNNQTSVPVSVPEQDNIMVAEMNEKKKAGNGMLIGMILCALIALGGVGFGVWAMMDGNTKEVKLNEEISKLKQQIAAMDHKDEEKNEGGETGNWYGKPNSVEDLESISISYNNGKDQIDVFEKRVDYYSYDDDGNIIRESLHEIEMDTSEIRKYVFDNYLDYLTEYAVNDEHDWLVTVDGPGTTCVAFGKSEHPKWLDDLLARLNVSEYGNYSKKMR